MIISPLGQFEVTNLINFNSPLFSELNLTLTNFSLYIILMTIVIVGLHYLSNNENYLVHNNWSLGIEASYQSLKSMVNDQIGGSSKANIYFPFIYSIFFYVLISNLISNIPYSFGTTTSGVMCLGLSFTIFLGVTTLALYLHKVSFFSFFIPAGTPLALVPLLVLIETVSYLARAISLGVRLFANLTAGHTLLKILSTFLFKLFSSGFIVAILTLIPFSIFLGLIVLEIAVSFIQAFVFTLLTCSYLKDAIYLH